MNNCFLKKSYLTFLPILTYFHHTLSHFLYHFKVHFFTNGLIYLIWVAFKIKSTINLNRPNLN